MYFFIMIIYLFSENGSVRICVLEIPCWPVVLLLNVPPRFVWKRMGHLLDHINSKSVLKLLEGSLNWCICYCVPSYKYFNQSSWQGRDPIGLQEQYSVFNKFVFIFIFGFGKILPMYYIGSRIPSDFRILYLLFHKIFSANYGFSLCIILNDDSRLSILQSII